MDPADNAAAPAQNVVVAAGPAGQLNLKIEQNKLPVFYGQKNKDTITAAHMISRVKSLIQANGWTPEQAYNNFALALQGAAQEWFRSLELLADDHQKTWEFIEPKFRSVFATQEDDSALLDQLANFAMKSTDDVVTYSNRVHRIIEIINTNCPAPPALPAAADANGVHTAEEIAAHDMAVQKSVIRYVALQIFRAGLPKDLRAAVSQQKPETYAQAFDIAKDQDMIRRSSQKPSILPVEEDPEIDAIQPNFRPQRPLFQQQSGNNWNNRSNSNNRQQQQQKPQQRQNKGPGNNASNNSGIVCSYCRIPNHHQDDCRKRIAANKPCIGANGRPYWPKKVYAVDQEHTPSDINSVVFQ